MNTYKNQNETINKTDVICCDVFKKNIRFFGWCKLEYLNEVQYVMPRILGTKYRVNFCPSCGKNIRDIVLSYDFYHNPHL